MVQKYIIDKADIHSLLTGKEIPLGQGNKARAFCVEIAGGMTSGEVIQALFPNETLYEQTETCTYYGNMRFDTSWWNAPYKADMREPKGEKGET